MFGFPDTEALVGLGTLCLYEDEVELQRLGAQVARALAHDGTYSGSWAARRQDGSRFWGHTVLTALRGADGRPLGFSALTRDMTEVRRLQAEGWSLALNGEIASPARLMELLGSTAVLPELGALGFSGKLGPGAKLSELALRSGASTVSGAT